MRITRIRLFLVETTMKRTFTSTLGDARTVRHVVIGLEGETGDPGDPGSNGGQSGVRPSTTEDRSTPPIQGWGEAPTPIDPVYVGDTPESTWSILRSHLVPLALGTQWAHPGELARLLSKVQGNELARHGLEAAAWDLWARAKGKSLSLGLSEERGRPSVRVVAGASLGIQDDLSRLADLVDECVDRGYGRVKLKVTPGRDIEIVETIAGLHPRLSLVADANGAYRLDEPGDVAALKAMDSMGILAIEQPLSRNDLVGHARLQEMLVTPVALDEAITSPDIARAAIRLGSCRVVSIKAPRLGGFSSALAVLDVCVEEGVGAWCGGMHELGIGRAGNIALGSVPGFTLPGDMAGSEQYFEEDIVDPRAEVSDGHLIVPTSPGLGCDVLGARIEQLTTATAEFSAPEPD